MEELTINDCIGFEWDEANATKIWNKHDVLPAECEQVFFNEPLLLFEDIKHSCEEKRIYVLGKTDDARALFIVFTIRNELIRIISARDMSKKERKIYEQT